MAKQRLKSSGFLCTSNHTLRIFGLLVLDSPDPGTGPRSEERNVGHLRVRGGGNCQSALVGGLGSEKEEPLPRFDKLTDGPIGLMNSEAPPVVTIICHAVIFADVQKRMNNRDSRGVVPILPRVSQ